MPVGGSHMLAAPSTGKAPIQSSISQRFSGALSSGATTLYSGDSSSAAGGRVALGVAIGAAAYQGLKWNSKQKKRNHDRQVTQELLFEKTMEAQAIAALASKGNTNPTRHQIDLEVVTMRMHKK